MTRHFDIPILYRNTGKPPKCRSVTDYNVSAVASIAFREISADELEPGLIFVSRRASKDGSDEHVYESPLQLFEGHMVRPLHASTRLSRFSHALTVDDLADMASEDTNARSVPEELRVQSLKHRYSGALYMAETIHPRHVETDGFAAAVAELQAMVDRDFVLVDGALHRTADTPNWQVWISNDDVSVCPTMKRQGHFDFPADCEAEAREFAAWCAERTGLPLSDGDRTRYELRLRTEALPREFDPVVEAARTLASRADLNVVNSAPFGTEAREAGVRFQATPNEVTALAFVEALQEGAATTQERLPSGYRPFFVEAFWKFHEVLPARYKGDEFAPINIYETAMTP